MLVVLLLIALLTAFSQECRVETREVVRAIYGSGYVKSKRQVLIRAGVSGYIKKVFVEEGDRVKKGQLIAVIESRGLENRIASLEKRIELLRERLRPESDFLKALEGRIRMAKENLEKARKRYERRKELYEKGVIPRENLEEAERLFKVAKEELRIAEETYNDKIKELRTQLEALLEEKKALERELESYRIRSPLSGVVFKVFVEEGDYVNHIGVDNRIAVVGTQEKKVVLNIDEEFLPLVEKGQEVYIRSDAFPEKVFKGRVVSFDLKSDRTRRVVSVKVKVNLPKKIPIDSVVEGNIVVDRLKTTVVPLRAVKNGEVTLLVNGERRRVKVGRVFDNYAEVLGFPSGTPCLFPEKP